MTRLAFLKRHWVLLLALTVYALLIVQTITGITAANEGHFVYALDDTYIHMAIAKNFAQHGVWGITRYHFTSSSSSLLWTLLIAAGYKLMGAQDMLPLVLNIMLGAVFIAVVYAILRRYRVPLFYTLAGIILLMLFIPIHTFVVVGMEHLLHTLLCVAFVFAAVESMATAPAGINAQRSVFNAVWWLCLLGAGVTAARYEGLFVVAAVCGVLALRKQFTQGVMVGVVSVLPLVIYGLIALAHGWTFLPVTLLLKSGGIQNEMANPMRFITEYMPTTYVGLQHLPVLGTLVMGLGLLFIAQYIRRRNLWDLRLCLLIVCVIALLLHARFVWDPGQFYRYSVYIVVTSLIVALASVGEGLPRRLRWNDVPLYAALALLAPLLLGSLWSRYRDVSEWQTAVAASHNIYTQQYQMARFLHTYYDDAVIVLQDIGAVSYFTDGDILDIWGLGTLEVANARLEGSYDLARMTQIVRDSGAVVAVVYETWLTPTFGQVSPQWVAVGSWTIENPIVVAGATVTFYALMPEAVESLIANLQAFKDLLPHAVYQQGRYVDELPQA